MDEKPIWLIWSNEHGAWWRPAGCGYIRVIEEAGRYSRSEAQEICDGANRYLPKGTKPNEVMVLSPEGVSALLLGTIDRIVKDALADEVLSREVAAKEGDS